MLAAIATLLLAVGSTPVPKSTGPIPVTADSYPFMAASKSTPATDLSKLGYIEEEFLVSGRANVYDWAADGALSVKTPNAPYTTRILVRRPATGFSGTVVVELLFPARRFDWSMMWGFSRDYIVEHKDAWVGITLPSAAEGLKKFNPTRYADVSFANPAPGAADLDSELRLGVDVRRLRREHDRLAAADQRVGELPEEERLRRRLPSRLPDVAQVVEAGAEDLHDAILALGSSAWRSPSASPSCPIRRTRGSSS